MSGTGILEQIYESGHLFVECLRDIFIQHSENLFQMPAGEYQFTERGVMGLSRRPGLYEHEGLRVGLILQDVKRLTSVSTNHALPTFALQCKKRSFLT
jgi:hypothetical protein